MILFVFLYKCVPMFFSFLVIFTTIAPILSEIILVSYYFHILPRAVWLPYALPLEQVGNIDLACSFLALQANGQPVWECTYRSCAISFHSRTILMTKILASANSLLHLFWLFYGKPPPNIKLNRVRFLACTYLLLK